MQRCIQAQKTIPRSEFKAEKEDFFTDKIVTSQGVSVTADDLSTAIDGQLFRCTLNYECKGDNFKSTYLYYKCWTDQQAPSAFEHLEQLSKIVCDSKCILAHCSAGLGRSSTFVICLCLYKMIIVDQCELKGIE